MNSVHLDKAADGAVAQEDVIILRRHWGQWIGAAVVIIVVCDLIYGAASNSKLKWSVVGQYLFSSQVLGGLKITIEVTVMAMVVAIIGGIVLALMRLSSNRVLQAVSVGYGILFRGVPVMVQLLFWYFLAAIEPNLSLGFPFGGPHFFSVATNTIITQLGAATIGFGLHEAAYMSEIIRSGIISVDPGQQEAASALGMTRAKSFRRVILPQAMRIILPPTGNQLISLFKATSLVLVIGLADLLTVVTEIYARNFEQIPLLIVASIWYLVITGVLSIIQYYMERHFGRGARSASTSSGKVASTDPLGALNSEV